MQPLPRGFAAAERTRFWERKQKESEMDSAPTPGPWIVESDLNTHVIRGAPEKHTAHYDVIGDVVYEHRDYVASTWGGPHEANARRIAAAPEMLEALETCEAFLLSAGFSGSDAYAEVCAAIAKATGHQLLEQMRELA